MSDTAKEAKRVFVIMPFTRTVTRNEAHLRSFFENNIQGPIEAANLLYSHTVHRSGETFDITAEIVRDVCRADIVIADLSGTMPNPNVMYELGLRLAVSDLPVILIRESHPNNERVFDITGFYTFDYDTLDYSSLEKHIVGKIGRLERGEETYINPVSQIIRGEVAKLNASHTRLNFEQQRALVLEGLATIDAVVAGAYGPLGKGVLVTAAGGVGHVELRGSAIAASQRSSNVLEEKGIRFAAQAALEIGEDIGDGTKLPVLLAVDMIRGCVELEEFGATRDEIGDGMLRAVDVARGVIRGMTIKEEVDYGVALTAAKSDLDIDVAGAVRMAGPRGFVTIDDQPGATTTVSAIDGFWWERGAIDEEFVSECAERTCNLDDVCVLVSFTKIGGMRELLPLLEEVARAQAPLLIVAPDYDDEATATLLTNVKAGRINALAVRGDATGRRAVEFFRDLSIFTGCEFINSQLGLRLENARLLQLGRARRVTVTPNSTCIQGGNGDTGKLERHIRQLEQDAGSLEGFDHEKAVERVARLGGIQVTIGVGGRTTQDRRINRYRVESALRALAAATASGAVPGAGLALFRAASSIMEAADGSESEVAGFRVVANALKRPLRVLLTTAGVDVESTCARIAENSASPLGLNVRTREVVDLRAAGILDPSDLLIRAVEIATDTARSFLETGSWQ